MTDKADIAALRKLALKATQGEWRAFTDAKSRTCAIHTPEDKGCNNIIDWMGFDGAVGSRKQKADNAKYIAAANPATILSLLDQLDIVSKSEWKLAGDLTEAQMNNRVLQQKLEAERQRAAGSEEELHKALHREKAVERKLLAAQEEIETLKAKLANPVVLPTRKNAGFYSDEEFSNKDLAAINNCAILEIQKKIHAAGFTTVKGES